MATADISRVAFDPRKRYAGVRMQQGRVIARRRLQRGRAASPPRTSAATLLDVIGPAGTPG